MGSWFGRSILGLCLAAGAASAVPRLPCDQLLLGPDSGGAFGAGRSALKPEIAEDLAKNLLHYVIRPVLEEAGRLGAGHISWARSGGNSLGWVVSTPKGTYTFLITNADKPADEDLGDSVPVVNYDIDAGNRMWGVSYFQERWLTHEKVKDPEINVLLQGIVRAQMVGDDVNPHRRSAAQMEAGADSILSYVQRDTYDKATRKLETYKKKNPSRVPRVGVFGPGGIGKTILFSSLARWVFERNQDENGLIIFSVESEQVLNSAFEKLTRELHVDPKYVWNFYGRNKQQNPVVPLGDVRILLTTRTGLNRLCREQTRLKELTRPGKKKRSIVWGLDEAQHVPASTKESNGQFLEGLRFLEGEIGLSAAQDNTAHRLLDEKDAIIMISATMTHSDNPGLITDRRFLDGSIVGMFLTEEETGLLAKGTPDEVMRLAARQVRRAMALGYLSWINFVDTKPIEDADGRSVLNRKVIEIDPETELPEIKEVVEPSLIQDVAQKLMEIRKANPHMIQRAVVFVEGTFRSNVFAEELQRELRKQEGALSNPTVAHPFHSKTGSFEDASDWLQDRQVRRVNARGNIVLGNDYGTEDDLKTHKLAVVDSIIGEGADLPNVNIIIIARDVDARDTGSVARLYQNILRGTRVAPYKQKLFLVDYSLVVDAFFKEVLSLRPQVVRGKKGPGAEGPLRVIGAVVHDLGAEIKDEVLDLILRAQAGDPTEYGFLPGEDVFLLRRAPFLIGRPEGQELALTLIRFLKAIDNLDHEALRKTPAGRDFLESLSRRGIFKLQQTYAVLRGQIEKHFNDRIAYMKMLEAEGAGSDDPSLLALGQELRDAADELSGSAEIFGFWRSMSKWLQKEDPLRGEDAVLELNFQKGRGDRVVMENMVQLYQELSAAQDSRLQSLDHQSLDVEVLSLTDSHARLRIKGSNVWPYLFREGGLHVWSNQIREGKPHEKRVTASFREKPSDSKLEALDESVAGLIDTEGNSSGSSKVRNYDVRTAHIYSQDDYPMPGPMRAQGVNRGSKIELTDEGKTDWANIFRRNASIYYLALVNHVLNEMSQFLPSEGDE